MRLISRRVTAVATAASVLALIGSLASSSAALALVAPVTAGPPRPTHVRHLDLNSLLPGDDERFTSAIRSAGRSTAFTPSRSRAGQGAQAAVPPPHRKPDNRSARRRLDALLVQRPAKAGHQPENRIPERRQDLQRLRIPQQRHADAGRPARPVRGQFTKAGRFTFDCLIHPGMQGVVKVLPKGAHVPTVTKDHATALAEYTDAVAKGPPAGQGQTAGPRRCWPGTTAAVRSRGSGSSPRT